MSTPTKAHILLSLCAVIDEPLFVTDILAVAPDHFSLKIEVLVAGLEAGSQLQGNGVQAGYAFADPVWQASYSAGLRSSGEWSVWQQRFLDHSRKVLAELRAGRLAPGKAPSFVVRGYGRALEQAGAPLADLYGLLCRPWADAWEWLGQAEGFQADAVRVFDRAAPDPASLGFLVRAALCRASVSHWHPIPPKILAALLERGLVSPPQALALAPTFNGYAEERAETLAALLPFMPAKFVPLLKEELLALDYIPQDAQPGEDEEQRLQVELLPIPEAERRLAEIETAPQEGKSWDERCDEITSLLEVLPVPLLPRGIDLWEMITETNYPFPLNILPRLPVDLVGQVYRVGLGLFYSSNPRAVDCGLEVITALLGLLSQDQMRGLLESFRFTSLFRSEFGWGGLPVTTLRAVLDALRQAGSQPQTADAIQSLEREMARRETAQEPPGSGQPTKPAVPQQPPEPLDLPRELAEARGMKNPLSRADALARLAARLPLEARRPLLEEAVALLPGSENAGFCASVITRLAPLLPADLAQQALAPARELAEKNPLVDGYPMWSHAELTLALAACFDDSRRAEMQQEAVRLARLEPSHFCRAHIFHNLLPGLPAAARYPLLEGIWELDTANMDYGIWSNVYFMLPDLAAQWDEMCIAAGASPYEALVRTLRFLAAAPRWVLSGALPGLLPIFDRLGGEGAVCEAVKARLDVEQDWP